VQEIDEKVSYGVVSVQGKSVMNVNYTDVKGVVMIKAWERSISMA
jgi:hypothetical protein